MKTCKDCFNSTGNCICPPNEIREEKETADILGFVVSYAMLVALFYYMGFFRGVDKAIEYMVCI